MRAVVAHTIKSVREVNTKFGPRCVAEVEFVGEPKQELWMSPKQGNQLRKCFDELERHGGYSGKHGECHIMLDHGERGDRFVWCGMHTPKRSDLEWLEHKFGVTCNPEYVARHDAAIGEADASLVDE